MACSFLPEDVRKSDGEIRSSKLENKFETEKRDERIMAVAG